MWSVEKRYEKKHGVVRGKATPFYSRKEGKKPVLLYILPVLMALVLLGTLYLAYRDSASPGEGVSSSVSSVFSQL